MADEQHPARRQDSLGKWDDVVPVFVVNGDEVGGGGTGGGGLTDAQLRATPVPVSGPLTDAQLRATPVPVAVSGEVEIKNDSGNPIPVAGPLTDAQLRATALPLPSGAATEAKQDSAIALFGALNAGAPANDTADATINGRLQRIAQRITSLIALLPASLGIKTAAGSLSVAPASDAAFVLGAGTAAIGTATAVGNVASGTADSGNPVKVGGKYSSTLPTLTDGQRGDLQLDSRGNLNVSVHGVTSASSDGVANANILNFQSYVTQAGGNAPLQVAGTYFNGTTWDRVRGDATGGAWVHGAVASGAADVGNPVKVGGRYNSTSPVLTDGQRGDLQLDSRGNLSVTIATGANVTSVVGSTGADASGSISGLQVYARPSKYNGTTWDRDKKPISVARLLSALASTNATSVKTSATDVFFF